MLAAKGSGPLESKPVFLIDDHFVDVGFPGDFPPTRPLAPGVYTVLWHNGGFLACDGFVIR